MGMLSVLPPLCGISVPFPQISVIRTRPNPGHVQGRHETVLNIRP